MVDNYEKDETIDPCEDCSIRFNPERCKTCKHRHKKTKLNKPKVYVR